MPILDDIRDEHLRILAFREGARYRRMDLHTHSPASECSDYDLPEELECEVPVRDATRAGRERNLALLSQIARGERSFVDAFDRVDRDAWVTLGATPTLDSDAIREIAYKWHRDLVRLDVSPGEEGYGREFDERFGMAVRDLRAYLASLFFPSEFVLRCYVEGLELVALTDHNHPGYIVPRVPRLGTWRGALQEVNRGFLQDLRRGPDPCERVRGALVRRLELAERRLAAEEGEVTRRVDANHREKGVKKRLHKLQQRLEHVRERARFWRVADHRPRPLTLLPGTEITVSNVHLLAVFPPEWFVPSRIASVLNDIGIPEAHWGRGFVAAATASVQDTIDLVDRAGGIAIPAHANSDFKGLLRLFEKGLALTKVLEHPALLALETVGGTVIKGEGGKRGKPAWKTLQWLDVAPHRQRRSKPLCFVKGSDAHECRVEIDGKGEDLGMRFTWVKIDIRPNDTPAEVFRSLRLALLSGQSRVVEHPAEDGFNYTADRKKQRVKAEAREALIRWQDRRPVILGVAVHGAGSYADGIEARFNPHLNCVIGAGGKSTLVRSVGYALGVHSFLPRTRRSWLPDRTRVYWRRGRVNHCVQREGRDRDPWGDAVQVSYYEMRGAEWTAVDRPLGDLRRDLADLVEIWPPVAAGPGARRLVDREPTLIRALARELDFDPDAGGRPLLVNQPREIFESRALFAAVLARPHLKDRQIIWSTGSPNVPTALDAEKIVVTREIDGGKGMEIVCAGDLHEEEIRQQFVDHFEGGWLGFARRMALYTS